MDLTRLKSLIPHVTAVLLFVVISIAYFTPLLEGKKIKQHDILMFKGMSKEIVDYRDKTGKEALWTNSMFGGMPAYQISILYKNNVAQYVNKFLSLGLDVPAGFLFLSLLGFYILLLAFKLDPWLCFVGALAFGFSSYFFIIDAAGHNSKAHAMAFMAPVIAGILLSFRGKYLLGGILTSLFFALQLSANHIQITYYTFLIILILVIVELTMAIKERHIDQFLKASGVLLIAVVLSIGVNFSNLYLTNEYGKYSTRGKSELTSNSSDKTSGLDKSYILDNYSYGIGETFNLFIPNFVGGPSVGPLSTSSETYKYFVQNYTPEQARSYIKQMPLYWGGQYSTSGPVYIGAVIIFLFVLGLFAVKGALKWWLVASTILSILLAWGKNFEFFSTFFIDYFPGYNKFRTVSMILVIAEFAIPLLGILGLWKMIGSEIANDKKLKYLRNATAITGGFALLFVVAPGMFLNFIGSGDAQMGWPQPLLDTLQLDRKSILQADAFRSLAFVILSAGVLFGFLKQKISLKITYAAFALLILIDLGAVGKRYLNSDNFTSQRESKDPFKLSPADEMILKDDALDYRVLNLAVNTFNDASTSWYHKSIGGYHGAKLKRYQELIDYHIDPETRSIIKVFNSKPSPESIDSLLSKLGVLDMLNTKYVIYNPEAAPLVNTHALNNAWFVSSYQVVKNADEEILAMKGFNPAKVAIIDERFKAQINNVTLQPDSLASIQLTEYEPNRLVYKTSAKSQQMGIFSEVYYDKGWNVYVDDKATPYFRANYVLRGMLVPAGQHKIEFRFEPKSFALGEKISLASSIVLVLLILGFAFTEGYKWIKK